MTTVTSHIRVRIIQFLAITSFVAVAVLTYHINVLYNTGDYRLEKDTFLSEQEGTNTKKQTTVKNELKKVINLNVSETAHQRNKTESEVIKGRQFNASYSGDTYTVTHKIAGTTRPSHEIKHETQTNEPIIPSFKSQHTNCVKLFANDRLEQKDARTYQLQHPKIPLPNAHYISLTRNCSHFKNNRKYVSEPLSEEEGGFSIAFSILIYKDIEQFERLFRVIYRPQNYYCIHIDVKSKPQYRRAVQGITDCFDNVFMASRSIDVRWGGYSVLEPELVCMQDLLKFGKWKYFINLTGQEFPLQTMWDIVKILKAYNGANNMETTVKR